MVMNLDLGWRRARNFSFASLDIGPAGLNDPKGAEGEGEEVGFRGVDLMTGCTVATVPLRYDWLIVCLEGCDWLNEEGCDWLKEVDCDWLNEECCDWLEGKGRGVTISERRRT